MKYKRLVLISTVLVFVMMLALAFVWLGRVRFVYVRVDNNVSDNEIYKKAEDTLTDRFKGKLFFSVSVSDIENELKQYPYAKVLSVKKSFPDRLDIVLTKRQEAFVFNEGDKYYVMDSEYYLLREAQSDDEIDSTVTRIHLKAVDLGVDKSEIGSKVDYKVNKLFGYMTTIYGNLNDNNINYAANIVKEIVIDGEKEFIYLRTNTGVTLSFWFDRKSDSVAKNICNSVSDVKEYYESRCDEYKKRNGYISVVAKDTGKVAIEWAESEGWENV